MDSGGREGANAASSNCNGAVAVRHQVRALFVHAGVRSGLVWLHLGSYVVMFTRRKPEEWHPRVVLTPQQVEGLDLPKVLLARRRMLW